MINKNKILKEIEFNEFAKISLNKIYSDVEKAIEARKQQSIYRLSKIITRYSLR